MEQFFKDLGSKIENAVKKEMPKILKEIGNETIYTAALVTDSDCITLYLALNTREYLQKTDEKDAAWDDLPKKGSEKNEEDSNSPAKWIPDEWGYSVVEDSALNEISELLYAYDEDLSSDDESRARYGELFFETVTQAFKNLIAANVFGENSAEITYFLSMSDDERTPAIENYSAKLLNPEPVYEEFVKELRDADWEDDSPEADSGEEAASGEISGDFSWKTLMNDYFGIC